MPSPKMACPYCQSLESRVVDGRTPPFRSGFWRRRMCLGCGERYITEEVIRGRYDPPPSKSSTSL